MGWRNGRAARNNARRVQCNKASTAIALISLVWFGVGIVILRDGAVEIGYAADGLNRDGGPLTIFNTTSNTTEASGDPADAGAGLYNFLGGLGMIVIPLGIIVCCCLKGKCTAHNLRAVFGGGGGFRRRRWGGRRVRHVSPESAVIAGAIVGGAMVAAGASGPSAATTSTATIAVQPQPPEPIVVQAQPVVVHAQ